MSPSRIHAKRHDSNLTASQLQKVLPVDFLQRTAPESIRGRGIMYLEEKESGFMLKFRDGDQQFEFDMHVATDQEQAVALSDAHIYKYNPGWSAVMIWMIFV